VLVQPRVSACSVKPSYGIDLWRSLWTVFVESCCKLTDYKTGTEPPHVAWRLKLEQRPFSHRRPYRQLFINDINPSTLESTTTTHIIAAPVNYTNQTLTVRASALQERKQRKLTFVLAELQKCQILNITVVNHNTVPLKAAILNNLSL
jgi:hypothetical protein